MSGPGRNSGALFSVPGSAVELERIRSLAEGLSGRGVAAVEPIGTGGNSRVYRVQSGDLSAWVLKVYPPAAGARDRRAAEFHGLQLLWGSGVRTIPQPIATCPGENCSLLEYIPGAAPPPESVSRKDVDAAAAFLGRLKDLADQGGAVDIGDASEARFSPGGVADTIRDRLDRLTEADGEGEDYEAMAGFLDDLRAALQERCDAGRREAAERGVAFDEEVPMCHRTLSPSDFGFHNTVRRPSGHLAFLDFEHFGWDDPVKTVSDFVLHPHPGMRLSSDVRRRFVERCLSLFGEGDTRFADRLTLTFPLFGLKWCTILLNEFLGSGLARREFAAGEPLSAPQRRWSQLEKARQMLRTIPEPGSSIQDLVVTYG